MSFLSPGVLTFAIPAGFGVSGCTLSLSIRFFGGQTTLFALVSGLEEPLAASLVPSCHSRNQRVSLLGPAGSSLQLTELKNSDAQRGFHDNPSVLHRAGLPGSALGRQWPLQVQNYVRPRKLPAAFAINHPNYSPLIKIKSRGSGACCRPVGRGLGMQRQSFETLVCSHQESQGDCFGELQKEFGSKQRTG